MGICRRGPLCTSRPFFPSCRGFRAPLSRAACPPLFAPPAHHAGVAVTVAVNAFLNNPLLMSRQVPDRDFPGDYSLQILLNEPYDATRKLEGVFRLRWRRREWTAGVPKECRIRSEGLSSGQETGKGGFDGPTLSLELDHVMRVLKRHGMHREESL